MATAVLTLLLALVGAALSASGAAFQGLFKNPMVSPDILGASSWGTEDSGGLGTSDSPGDPDVPCSRELAGVAAQLERKQPCRGGCSG